MDFSTEKIRVYLDELNKRITVKSTEICGFLYTECEYKSSNVFPKVTSAWRKFEKNDLWGGEKGKHYWFYNKFHTNNETVFKLSTGIYGGWGEGNPQILVYLNGEMVYGMDCFHDTIEIMPNTDYEMYIYAYTNDADKRQELRGFINEIDEDVKKLYYDISVPYDICSYLEKEDKIHIDTMEVLKKAINMVDMRSTPSDAFSKSVILADEYLQNTLYNKKIDSSKPCVLSVGHSHIDCAYLWTVKQTREKVQRTFSTVVSMMKRYPEYKFMASTAQLYEFAKEEAPELYAEIKELIKAGRWDAEGAMWVEADCNLLSGESLVRQILLGKEFFKEEFDIDCKVLWLPDVFGYSAALPQILKKSGIDTFITSKISWSETNTMPHDTFMWQGIDGTEILTYFLTAQDKNRGEKPVRYCTYSGLLTPQMTAGTWERYQDKNINDEVILTYGYGDGGGGPTERMIEVGRRLEKGLDGCPIVKFGTVTEFCNNLHKKLKKVKLMPKWAGELYLEFHRGTYTSMAKNKRKNRKAEYLYHNAELVSLTDNILLNEAYPKSELKKGWKGILLNQFHDIIPGSSIKDVYTESDLLYDKIYKIGNDILDKKYINIAGNLKTNGGILVFNNTPFVQSGCAMVDGKEVYVKDIPANGYKVVMPTETKENITVTRNAIENKFYKIKFKNGNISKIYDKLNKREVIKKGELANRLLAFEDYPRKYDAWEITNYYAEKSWVIDDVVSTDIVDYGEKAGLKIKKAFLNSVIVQEILVYKNIERIDFETYIDWKEHHILLKADFPIDVHTDKATFDIQFGNVERPTHRNTSWDEAKFEVCAHKFADVSEDDYGAALMNDCKYGYDVLGSNIRLTLLKSATYPNPDADKCEHYFTYSLYPHKNNVRNCNVVKQAYLLNNPLCAIRVNKNNGILPEEFSFVSADKDNVIIDTVKMAEKTDEIIIRMYECCNRRTETVLTFGFDVNNVAVCDLMENELTNIKVNNNSVKFEINPYEIVTLKIARRK